MKNDPEQDARHAAAPAGYKCSDCTIDGEACPTCYAAWWKKRHPNHITLPLAAVPAQEEGWQPIETAPKDGTTIMLKGDGWSASGYHGRYPFRWVADIDTLKPGPTHWRPLPDPPGAPAAPHDAREQDEKHDDDVARGRSADVDSATGSPRSPQPDGSQQASEALTDRDRLAFLRTLLQAYRRKRAVDGLNNRDWHADVHWKAEQEIGQLEAQWAALEREEHWTGDEP